MLIITSGIGRSTAYAFARAGVKGLIVADINTKALNETVKEIKADVPGVAIVSLHLDVGDEASCTDCMIAAFKAFERIDYAVNNVGIGGSHIPTVQQTTSEFMQVLNINIVGLWTCQREQVRYMLEQKPLNRRKVQSFSTLLLMSDIVRSEVDEEPS
jgi:NAD(P)-dependent dehydrogenase (short-subunit alcohol dehydrogenase family)